MPVKCQHCGSSCGAAPDNPCDNPGSEQRGSQIVRPDDAERTKARRDKAPEQASGPGSHPKGKETPRVRPGKFNPDPGTIKYQKMPRRNEAKVRGGWEGQKVNLAVHLIIQVRCRSGIRIVWGSIMHTDTPERRTPLGVVVDSGDRMSRYGTRIRIYRHAGGERRHKDEA
jgi:hypothetical protein